MKFRNLQRISAHFNIKTDPTFIAMMSLLISWIILYTIYLLNHDIPANPGGFYLKSAEELSQNGFLIPAFVQGFGLNGIPFVYSPLAFYVLGVTGYIFGGIVKSALYIPGILLLIQAVLMYFFMKQFTESKQAPLWAALILLLMPQMFSRTMFADGITTGLAGIFLLASWIAVLKPVGKLTLYSKSILGGVFVGLSILSHPAIGLFAAVSLAILHLNQNGINLKSIKALFFSGFIAFLVIFPWLFVVISYHGIAPLLAGIKDSKSFGSILSNLNYLPNFILSTGTYILEKYISGFPNTISFLLFPFALALIYSIIDGPRVLVLLLLAGLITMRGHPSVTLFVLAASLGLFYDRFLFLLFSQKTLQHQDRNYTWQFIAIFIFHVAVLFFLCLHYYTSNSPFSSGELETYNWVRLNTKNSSTFLTEYGDEKLVYFGERTILLPTLGAEWIPDSEYGNWLKRDTVINGEIFSCRETECLLSIFERYNLDPDYIIYYISDNDERAWIEQLTASSSICKVAFKAGNFITIQYIDTP